MNFVRSLHQNLCHETILASCSITMSQNTTSHANPFIATFKLYGMLCIDKPQQWLLLCTLYWVCDMEISHHERLFVSTFFSKNVATFMWYTWRNANKESILLSLFQLVTYLVSQHLLLGLLHGIHFIFILLTQLAYMPYDARRIPWNDMGMYKGNNVTGILGWFQVSIERRLYVANTKYVCHYQLPHMNYTHTSCEGKIQTCSTDCMTCKSAWSWWVDV